MSNDTHHKVPEVNLSNYQVDEQLIKDVSAGVVFRYSFIPIFKIGDTITIATAEPDNIPALDNIRKSLGCEVEPVYASKEDIHAALNLHYGQQGTIEDVISELKTESDDELTKLSERETLEVTGSDQDLESPVIKLINAVFGQAIRRNASDIHIEPNENITLVRFRIDGTLYEVNRIPKLYHPSLVSRIKVIGEMDIAESRIPQDGHARVQMNRRVLELRISSLPTIHGENIVIRLLNKGSVSLGLEQLGFSGELLDTYRRLLKSPNGMMLVTGPTGSGKTTSLYGSLSELNDESRNIVTLEDPVEYQLPLIRQVQIHPKAGLTFASGLRSILRQDPDIILVGEIRDLETGELATRASLTGHLVFSTLHTNDAIGAITRLVEMGVEPFLVASSVVGVLAQRLVRKICSKCKIESSPSKEVLDAVGLDNSITYYTGKGCKNCQDTGYSGRIPVFELVVLTEELRNMIIKGVSGPDLYRHALSAGYVPMQQIALDFIRKGETSPEEVLKVIQFSNE